MSIKRRLFSLVAVTAVTASTGIALVGVGSASADTVSGQLTMTPGTGNQGSLIEFTTPTGVKCPVGTNFVQVIITGQTLTEANPAIITGNTDYSQAQGSSNNLRVSGGSTMSAVWADAGISSPSGDYTFNLQCLDDNLQETRRFDVVTHWTATGGAGNGTYVADNPIVTVATSTVLSGPASSTAGGNVALTAAVTPASGPAVGAGTVQFKDGGTNLGSPVAVSAGSATFNTSSLTAGAHALTAEYIPASAAFGASSSNTLNHTVDAASTATTLVSNGPTYDGATANFTASVSPAVAGSVVFTEGPDTLATVPVNGSGVAAFSTTTLTVGTHPVVATFTPTNAAQYNGSASAPLNHVVIAGDPRTVTQNIIVEVPAGALTMVLDTGADGNVDLGTAVMDAAGEKLTASGDMDVVKITDTRAGDPGWVASGIVTNFTNGTDSINGFNLGWTPQMVSLSANQTGAFLIGSLVAAGTEGLPGTTPADGSVGLKASRTLGTAPDNSGNGTARLGAHLDLNVPTDVSAGSYAATLTLTVI